MRPLPWIVCFCLLAALPCTSRAEPKEFHLKLRLDPLLDLTKTWTLSAEDLEKQFNADGFKQNPYLRWSGSNAVAEFSTQPFSNISVELTLLEEKVGVEHARLSFDPDNHKPWRADFTCEAGAAGPLRAYLDAALQTKAQPGPLPAIGWKQDKAARSELWQGTAGSAVLACSEKACTLSLLRPGSDAAVAVRNGGAAGRREDRKLEFFVRLDQLMPLPQLWSMTQDELQSAASMESAGVKESPFYKWSTTARDSARFAQNVFSNTKADLLLFDDTVGAEEANIDFKNGRASKLVITLLTRGNSGEVSAGRFDEVFKATGRALGAKLGVRPSPTTVAGRQVIKTTAYLWTTAHTLALMEFNTEAPKGKVEFLRLTFAPASARAELLNLAGLGSNATTLSRNSLTRFVKRDAGTGDVEISGVPMRDQGAKGYCVAASCERLFRYLGQPTDMDEIAQVVKTDAERGTNPAIMYASLKKIDERYNMRLKLLKIPPRTSLGPVNISRVEIERAQRADLLKLIRENIDQGLPLLWAVLLDPTATDGKTADGSPALIPPGRPGMGLGHMRMIIGYNPKTNGVIYTDSWGAGHERKVMPLSIAEEMTDAVFSMAPNR